MSLENYTLLERRHWNCKIKVFARHTGLTVLESEAKRRGQQLSASATLDPAIFPQLPTTNARPQSTLDSAIFPQPPRTTVRPHSEFQPVLEASVSGPYQRILNDHWVTSPISDESLAFHGWQRSALSPSLQQPSERRPSQVDPNERTIPAGPPPPIITAAPGTSATDFERIFEWLSLEGSRSRLSHSANILYVGPVAEMSREISQSSRPPASLYISSISSAPPIPKPRHSLPEYYQLLVDPICPSTRIKTIILTAISSTGKKVAVLGPLEFSVFNIPDSSTELISLCCSGYVDNGGKSFHYSLGPKEKPKQQLLPKLKVSKFLCAALCDAYLAIGAPGRLMVCKLEGEHAGRMVIDHMFKDSYARIEQLAFSPEGTELLAIVKSTSTRNSTKLEILAVSTTNFPQPTLGELERKPAVSLDNLNVSEPLLFGSDWDMYTTPNGMSFSSEGTKVAIYTNWIAGKAGIQLLRKTESKWKFWGPLHRVPVFREDDRHEWQGVGLTGISLHVLVPNLS